MLSHRLAVVPVLATLALSFIGAGLLFLKLPSGVGPLLLLSMLTGLSGTRVSPFAFDPFRRGLYSFVRDGMLCTHRS
jgi:hypothetical protein